MGRCISAFDIWSVLFLMFESLQFSREKSILAKIIFEENEFALSSRLRFRDLNSKHMFTCNWSNLDLNIY